MALVVESCICQAGWGSEWEWMSDECGVFFLCVERLDEGGSMRSSECWRDEEARVISPDLDIYKSLTLHKSNGG